MAEPEFVSRSIFLPKYRISTAPESLLSECCGHSDGEEDISDEEGMT